MSWVAFQTHTEPVFGQLPTKLKSRRDIDVRYFITIFIWKILRVQRCCRPAQWAKTSISSPMFRDHQHDLEILSRSDRSHWYICPASSQPPDLFQGLESRIDISREEVISAAYQCSVLELAGTARSLVQAPYIAIARAFPMYIVPPVIRAVLPLRPKRLDK